jgi:hypothetical protein
MELDNKNQKHTYGLQDINLQLMGNQNQIFQQGCLYLNLLGKHNQHHNFHLLKSNLQDNIYLVDMLYIK